MIHKCKKELCRLSFVCICLWAAPAFMSISAGAQSSHASQTSKVLSSKTPQKEVKFAVVSIRPLKPGTRGGVNLGPTPNGYVSQMSVIDLIMAAYVPGAFENWRDTPLLNAPKWAYGTDRYEINARISSEDIDAWQHQGHERELLRSALRDMLKERFKLVIHKQPKEVQDYKLVTSKKRPKLTLNAPDPKLTPFQQLPGGGYTAITRQEGPNILETYFHAVTMESLCAYISIGSQLPAVHDATGLSGRYDFTLKRADPSQPSVTPYDIESLGLQIKAGKYQGFSLVVDHLERPTPN